VSVAITGRGVVSSLGEGADEFFDALIEGRSGIRDGLSACTEFDPERWIDPRNARRMDRFTQFGLVAALQAGGATVLTMRLPDPARMFGLPAGLARPLSRRMRAVNAELDKVAARYGTLHWDAPNDPETYDRRNWSVDRLHPNERGHRLIACRFWDSLAVAGHAVTAKPDPEPSCPGPTRRDDFWWMATKGTKWFLRRSVDLIPYLLFMAAREALAQPKEWVPSADAEWLPGIDETAEPITE